MNAQIYHNGKIIKTGTLIGFSGDSVIVKIANRGKGTREINIAVHRDNVIILNRGK